MNKSIRLFYVSTIIALIATSCGLPTSNPTDVQSVVSQATQASLAKLELSVQADTSVQYTTVGQIIKFTFPVKNIGTEGIKGLVTLTGVAGVCPSPDTVGDGNNAFDPGETINCTTDYPITQSDLDKGSVTISATATINGVVSNQAIATIPVGAPKVLSITVTANPTTFTQTGQQITFTYVIKNDGTTSLGPAQFTVSDNLVSNAPFACGNPDTTLPAGQTLSCSNTHAITDADMAQSSISNKATAAGGGSTTTQAASATISKGDPKAGSGGNPGTTISHTVVEGEWIWQIARCWGADPNAVITANKQVLPNPALIKKGMVLTIPNIGSNGKIYGLPCMVTHIVASGDTWDSIAKQYNADPGILKMVKRNSLTVGSTVYVPMNSAGVTSTSTSTGTKALSVTASANPTTYDNVNQQITLTYVIKNTGNTTLGPDQFKITDTLINQSAFSCGNANTSLQPNSTTTCTATYTIKQADMDQSSISNYATASGGGVNTTQAATVTLTRGAKSLALTTSANSTTYTNAGQQITFNYEIKNSGATSVGPAQFTITDTLVSPNAFNCGAANTTLAPGAAITCTANYSITDANMSQSSISNYATASGGGAGPSAAASTTVNKAVSGLSLTVTANPTAYTQAGQIITFNYQIKNNGTVNLGPAQFTIKDTLIGPTEFNCGEPNVTLAPNGTVECIKTYEITDAEMQETEFSNYAIALGGGAPASPAASATVTKQ